MRGLGRAAAFVLLCCILLAAPRAMKNAAVDVRERIRPQDTRWQGIIGVGFLPTFSMESAEKWLKLCAKAFAGENDNLLVSVREMTIPGVRAAAEAQQLPDVLVFGANALKDAEQIQLFVDDTACPVAAGAYALLGNRTVLETADWREELSAEETLALAHSKNLRIAVPRRDYADPLAALCGMGDAGDAVVQDSYARVWPDFALEEKYALYVATQREILRMQTLRSAGRGFETMLIVPDLPLAKDQTLLCAAVKPEWTARQDDEACAVWREKWIGFLVQDAQQMQLAQVGLFSVKGDIGLYEDGHPLCSIEELMPPCGAGS